MIVSKWLWTAVVLALFGPAAGARASGRLEGRLVDATGAAVAGASVSVVGSAGSVRTDGDGRFTWAPAPHVPFQLIVVLSGGQVARPVLVDAVPDGLITVQVAALADESVTVLGAAPSIRAAPASASTVMSATHIAQREPGNLVEALETIPGVGQVSEGHAAVPAVRGLARGRTLILVDGGRVTSERRVGPSATFLDPAFAEGIDVARGPGSVAYGSDALGGIISVRSRRAEPDSPWRATLAATVGTGIPERRGWFEVSRGFRGGGVLLQARARHADDYDSPRGKVFNSGWDDRGFALHATRAVGSGILSAAWQSDFGRDIGRPRANSRAVRFFYPFENSHRFTTTCELHDVAGFREVALLAFVGTYEQQTDQDRAATATAGRSIERADVSADDFQLKASAERLVGASRLEFGVDVNGRYNLEALDTTELYDLDGRLAESATSVSVADARRVDAGAYAQADAALGASARLSTGIRADRVTSENTGGYFGDRSTSHTALSGLAALTFEVYRGLSITAQVSRGFRDPVLSDRYYRGPTGRGFVTGNPGLQPETSLQFDVAARYAMRRGQVALYVYEYRVDDLVERYPAGTDDFLFRNRGRARLRGIELEARSELGRGFSIEVGGQVARGRATNDGADLDDIAPDMLALVARQEFGGRAHAHLRTAWYAADRRPGPTEIAAPGATLVEFGAVFRPLPQLELRGLARNLLDDEYFASPDPRWVLAPGRSFSVTAAARF